MIFTSDHKNTAKLESKISTAIKKKFGFDVVVIVITPEVIDYVLKNNPFIKKKKEIERLVAHFIQN